MKQHPLSRREFLSASAAGSGLSLAGYGRAAVGSQVPPPRQVGQKSVFGLKVEPLRRVRIGCVGVGGRGLALLGNLLSIDGVEIKAICDIVPTRVEAARQRVVAAGRAKPAGYSRTRPISRISASGTTSI